MFSTRSREQRQRKNTGADSNMRTSSSANSRRKQLAIGERGELGVGDRVRHELHAPPGVLDFVLGQAPRPDSAGRRRRAR